MTTFFQLFDFASGNVIASYAQATEAWAALRKLAAEHGPGAVHELGLLRFDGDDISLVAMDEDLVDRALESVNELNVARRSA